MTDQERVDFLALAEKYELREDLNDFPYPHGEMRLLCMGISELPSSHSQMLMIHKDMTPEYLDLMFETPTVFDVNDIFDLCECIQPRHIEMAAAFLMNADEFEGGLWSPLYNGVWGVLLSHPLCTDAMRVKYQLLRNT